MVLRLPRLNAVQWVYGAGHGRASDWLHVYRTCREAGKAVQILAEDAADALHVLRELGPDGVWLCIGAPFKNAGLAGEFLEEVHTLSA
jgi:aminoglycoside/choline kinase family phosphotransferase